VGNDVRRDDVILRDSRVTPLLILVGTYNNPVCSAKAMQQFVTEAMQRKLAAV
jgi:hypothetical protein